MIIRSSIVAITDNVLGLCVVVDLEPQKLKLLLMLNRITNVE